MGVHPQYQVVELFDPREPSLPRAVLAERIDKEPRWKAIWRHRDKLPGRLPMWFRTLSDAHLGPRERVFVGRAGLHEKCARAVCKHRIEQISRMAGTWPAYPSFLEMDRPKNVGKKGVPVYADGIVYPSRAAAARANGITRRAVYDRMQHAGWNWL